MSDAWIGLDADSSAARLVLQGLSARRAVGRGQLTFTVELTTGRPSVAGRHIWLSGEVQVRGLPTASGFVAPLRTPIQPLMLPDPGGTRTTTMLAEIEYGQLRAIEEERVGPVTLVLDFGGFWLIDGSPTPFWGVQVEHLVSQSDWVAVLERTGYGELLLLEFDAMRLSSLGVGLVFEHFKRAQQHYIEHEWRLTVESVRQGLAAMTRPEAGEDATDEATLGKELGDLNRVAHSEAVGYAARLSPVRNALKFYCDLGSHPEVEAADRKIAHAALIMMAGLLVGIDRTG